jgi:hypothetical protein
LLSPATPTEVEVQHLLINGKIITNGGRVVLPGYAALENGDIIA